MKAADNPRFITNTTIYTATGCTSLLVAVCYRGETILKMAATGRVVVYLGNGGTIRHLTGRVIGTEIRHLHQTGRVIGTATGKLVA